MKDKTYDIMIHAPRLHVWVIMLDEKTYPLWIKGF